MFNYSKAIFNWFKDDGSILLYKYNLNEESIVLDVGGYKGFWVKGIIEKYNCNIIVYEPINKYINEIKKKFSHYNKITYKNYGLGKKNQKIKVKLRGVQTTTQDNQNKNYDQIVEIKDINQEKEIIDSKIDLMSINIEGGEYDLLERMIELNMIKNILNIQIQFHEWFPSYELSKKIRKKIHNSLLQTHKLTFCYTFVWENWTLK